MKPRRQKHDYTSEIELNSLLIREKNRKLNKTECIKHNTNINKYIKTFVNLSNTKYGTNSPKTQKKQKLKILLRERITNLSEVTRVDTVSHEKFGKIILLMIKHILTKPNFSGYTYGTEFYSDAIHKILKYLHNFDHTLISERSGIRVNAFAYISQIIHNSIVFIIKKKKQEIIATETQVTLEITQNNLEMKDHRKTFHSTMDSGAEFEKEVEKEFKIQIKNSLVREIIKIQNKVKDDVKVRILYPSSYKITMDEYNEIKPLLKNLSIIPY